MRHGDRFQYLLRASVLRGEASATAIMEFRMKTWLILVLLAALPWGLAAQNSTAAAASYRAIGDEVPSPAIRSATAPGPASPRLRRSHRLRLLLTPMQAAAANPSSSPRRNGSADQPFATGHFQRIEQIHHAGLPMAPPARRQSRRRRSPSSASAWTKSTWSLPSPTSAATS